MKWSVISIAYLLLWFILHSITFLHKSGSLRNQNKNLENATLKEEERKVLENKCEDLLDKNEKLTKQLAGKLPLQGARHLIWDMIIVEAVKLKIYLNYILDKEIVIYSTKQSCTAVKEVLNKKPIDTTNNTMNFLDGLSEYDLKKISLITWEMKVVGKHQHLDTVLAKIDIMQHEVNIFKG